MKPRYYVVLLMLIPIVLFGALLIKEAQVPPEVLKELEYYLNFKTSSTVKIPSILNLSRAKRPWNFTPEMSNRSYRDSAYYFTDESYGAVHPDLSPIYYPPDDIWCAFMQRESEQAPQIVYVAVHVDLYNADWIVHEPASKYNGDIETIGCEMDRTSW